MCVCVPPTDKHTHTHTHTHRHRHTYTRTSHLQHLISRTAFPHVLSLWPQISPSLPPCPRRTSRLPLPLTALPPALSASALVAIERASLTTPRSLPLPRTHSRPCLQAKQLSSAPTRSRARQHTAGQCLHARPRTPTSMLGTCQRCISSSRRSTNSRGTKQPLRLCGLPLPSEPPALCMRRTRGRLSCPRQRRPQALQMPPQHRQQQQRLSREQKQHLRSLHSAQRANAFSLLNHP